MAQLEALPGRIGRRILDRLPQLEAFPESAPLAPFQGLENYRQFVVDDYCIIYRYVPQLSVVRVLSIRHGRQLPPTQEELEQGEAGAISP